MNRKVLLKPVISVLVIAAVLFTGILPLGCGNHKGSGESLLRDYKGSVAEESVLTSAQELSVEYGRGSTATVEEDGGFEIEGRVESAAMLRAVDEFGNTALMCIYPKTDLLPQRQARLDFMSSAAALVFSRPGFATPDPVAAAVLTAYIEKMPETAELASLLRQKSETNPLILENPDEEVLALVADICSKIIDDAEKASRGDLAMETFYRGAGGSSVYAYPRMAGAVIQGDIWEDAYGDTRSDWFADADGIDGDGIGMTTSYGGEGGRVDIAGINRYMRWVAVYCDPMDEAGNALLPEDSSELITPAAMLEPRNFSLLPTLSDLLKSILVDNYKDVLKEMIAEGEFPSQFQSPEDYGQELWEVVLRGLVNNYMPTRGEFTIETDTGTDYLVTTHGPGIKGSEHGGVRDHLPTLYTGITEICLPLIGLFLDVPDISPVLKETPSIMRLARKFEWKLQELIEQTQPGCDQEKAVYEWELFVTEFMQDPDFQALICAAYEVTADAISKIVDLVMGQAFPAIDTYNKIAGGVNLCVGVLGVVLAVTRCEMIDKYFLSPSGNTASLMQPRAEEEPRQQPALPPSGPEEALKGFFSALELGDTVAACGYVYTTSYGMSFVTWGAIGIYNLVGQTKFDSMTYKVTSNNGTEAQVYVTGNMDYGDQLGLVVNRYRIDGYSDLKVQDGAWKIVNLPQYTLVEVRTLDPENPWLQHPVEWEIPEDLNI